MIIGIDGYCLTHAQRKGLGNYLYHLINNLQYVIREDDTIVIFSPIPLRDSFERVDNIYSGAISSQYIWEQWELPKLLRKHHVDVLHCPANTRPLHVQVPTVVSVHDLIMFLPSKRSPYERYVKFFTRHSILKSNRLITVSEASERAIRTVFDTTVPIHAIHPGTPSKLPPLTNKSQVERKVVHFATSEPRKNTKLVLKTASYVPDIEFVLLGMTEEQVERSWSFAIPANVKCLGYVSEEEKIKELSTSLALLYVTNHEGFGFPILEAMAYECPVIVTKDHAVLETGGDAVIAIEGSVEGLTFAIQQCTLNEVRSEHIRLGQQNLQRFNWSRTAHETYAVYKQAQYSS